MVAKYGIKGHLVRDISWLSFNERVLQEAQDPQNHIHDRLKFLGIFSNNLDEFFRVRVATLKRMAQFGKKANVHLEENPKEILSQINTIVEKQQIAFRRTYTHIIKELGGYHIFIKNEKHLSREQKHFVKKYFYEQVYPNIVPLMIESLPQLPLLKDKNIYLACALRISTHPEKKRFALIEIPTKNIERFIILPSEPGEQDIILLEDIIRYNLPNIFAPFGFDDCEGHIIKVTRDAELDIDNDVNMNLITSIEKGLKNRKKGRTTRFVCDRNIDNDLLNYLIRRLGLTHSDYINKGGRIHNFKDFMKFPESVFDDIKEHTKPFIHKDLVQPCRIMDILDEKDILLHFPYHSFDSLIDLLREAAIDPTVRSIKITCYRLAQNSKIINTLINAAKNGKEVVVYLELRARFDEEANLYWKTKLEEEGVTVLVGVPDMKVHAKICVIKRVIKGKISYYGFLSTGNLNESTARIYVDTCLLTANKKMLRDAEYIFEFLAGPEQHQKSLLKCKTLLLSPVNMREAFLKLIEQEIKNAKRKKTAEIIIKLNSLVDRTLINKLYEAAHFGVKVQLIIRGICCAVTKNSKFRTPIRAISIVDRYLEHSRVFYFYNNNSPKVYVSSADWMVRNLDHRVETAFEIEDPALKQEITDLLLIELSENVKARILDNKQRNHYVETAGESFRAQEERYYYLAARTSSEQ